jgi:hypothetical protein
MISEAMYQYPVATRCNISTLGIVSLCYFENNWQERKTNIDKIESA